MKLSSSSTRTCATRWRESSADVFSDALDREAAWLNTISDALPILIASNGGPFQRIQARWPRTYPTRQTMLAVLRQPTVSYKYDSVSSQRARGQTGILLRAVWPVAAGTGNAQSDQLAFEQAIDLVITRVAGPFGDKSHGGRFLSVAEDRMGINVFYDDPEQALVAGAYRAQITYTADDPELVN